MGNPSSWSGRAFNQATASENKIHDDTVAARFGFRGGLVPGVTVFAYLAQPAVAAWGHDWLACGSGELELKQPLYDGEAFEIDVKPDDERAYVATALDAERAECAPGRFALPDSRVGAASPQAPSRRGDRRVPRAEDRPAATRDALERLRDTGMGAIGVTWHAGAELAHYVRNDDVVPDLVRPGRGGFANPGFTLGLANSVLSSNVHLGPWIHVQSRLQNFSPIPLGSRLRVEAAVVDLFERRGNEFVELDVAAFIEPDTPVFAARHRAIYRLREREDAG